MTVVIWIILAYIFIKCVGLVIRPFLPSEEHNEDDYEPTNQTTVNINISDSFNYHSSDSYYKGGDHYGSSNKEKESTKHTHNPYVEGTSLYDIWNEANQPGGAKRSDRYRY